MHRSSDQGFQSASGVAASPPTTLSRTRVSSTRARGTGQPHYRRWVPAQTLTLAPLLGISSACLDRPIGSPPPVTTNIFVDRITQTSVDKIDLLFMIDNSISMSDKQEV